MTIIYSPKSIKQIAKIDKPIQKKIFKYMDEVAKLANPRSRGKMLIGNLLGYWRYRVGDYRILCKIQDEALIIFVVEVGHRREVYNTKKNDNKNKKKKS